jgi:hypothetical protein
MPRVPFQPIDLAALHIQNTTVTPARKPVREHKTEKERKSREHLEKEMRRAQQKEREDQERLEKERRKVEQQQEARREEVARVKSLQERRVLGEDKQTSC